MESNLTMDWLITTFGQIGATGPEETTAVCKAAVNILFALSEPGAKTPKVALDIIYDYRHLAEQYANLFHKHQVAGKPNLKDGVWHCPDCNGRCRPNHSFCHRCGKKLGWR